jgi:HD-like signal output (HDOD) protein
MLDQNPADIVVTDMGMPGMDGAELLRRVAAEHPATIRVILSGCSDVQRAYEAAHQVIGKPCGTAVLYALVARSSAMLQLVPDLALRATLSTIRVPVETSELRFEIAFAAAGGESSTHRVAALIERDPPLAATVLLLAGTKTTGHDGGPIDVAQGIRAVGMELLDAVVLHHGLLEPHAPPTFQAPVDTATSRRHSLRVAALARTILGGAQADAGFVAGLLHDAGKLFLSRHYGIRYAGVVELVSSGTPAHEAERTLLGTTHAEAAGYLFGISGVPDGIVQAIIHHHAPPLPPSGTLDLTGAVHVANALVHGAAGGRVALDRRLAPGYLTAVGAADRLEQWRASAAHGVAA